MPKKYLAEPKVGRNDPCRKSGQKYKKCCGLPKPGDKKSLRPPHRPTPRPRPLRSPSQPQRQPQLQPQLRPRRPSGSLSKRKRSRVESTRTRSAQEEWTSARSAPGAVLVHGLGVGVGARGRRRGRGGSRQRGRGGQRRGGQQGLQLQLAVLGLHVRSVLASAIARASDPSPDRVGLHLGRCRGGGLAVALPQDESRSRTG